MTITSVGYDGTVDEVQWARIAASLGADYAVLGNTDWQVTTVVGQDRTVQVAAGSGFGHGVLDVNDAAVTLQLPVVASGTRWDLVVARRNWQPVGGTTVFAVVQGTASKGIPSGRLVGPGVQDDQPLALVQVTAGQTLPTAVVDLRAFPSKVITVGDLLALPAARLGTEAVVGTTRYRRVLDANSNPVWLAEPKLRGDVALGTLEGFTTDRFEQLSVPFTRDCPTGRVSVSIDATGSASLAGLGGSVAAQLDGAGGAILLEASAYHALAGQAGRLSYAVTRTVDVAPGAHTFRLLARRWSGSGQFSVNDDSALSVTDVRK